MKKPKLDPKRLKAMRKAVYVTSRVPLQEWINKVSQVDQLLSNAVEGIYCGEDGEMREQIGEYPHFLLMQWHSVTPGNPKVEVAYIS